MPGRDEPAVTQYRSPSFSQVAARSATASVRPKSNRPSAQRSVSGSAHTGQLTNLTTMDSPAQSPADESTPDPIVALGQTTPGPTAAHRLTQRSATTSPAVFGLTKLDQSGWSDSSGPNTSSSSSVWNGRGAHTADSDAVGTATTSNVSTPGRVPPSDSAELLGPGIKYAPPLLPPDGSAWANVRASTVIWPNDLSNSTSDFTIDAQASPIAAKQPTEDRPRKTVLIGTHDTQTELGSNPDRPDNQADRSKAKRAPIRSTTLDPSQLPGGKARSDEDDSPPDELVPGFNELSLGNANQDDSTALPDQFAGQSELRSPSLYGGAPGFMHRPSDSYAPFSGREGFVHPSPYMPASGVRSPDGFGPPFHPGMNNMPPLDMSGYESYRTTPDPYAPTMPGRAIFASPAGSQGSTPQSPAFGPATLISPYQPSMRGGEPMFYPGPPGGGSGGFVGPGPMMPSARPMMLPGAQQYPYGAGPGSDGRSPPLAQSPMLPHGMPMGGGNMMVSPVLSHMSPVPGDRRLSQGHGHGHQYIPGLHRRMGSNAESFVPLSPRPPYPMGPHQGGMMPGHMPMPGYPGGAPMQGPWNGRYPDHRQIPTGPGGVMAPPAGFAPLMDPRHGAPYFYNGNHRAGPHTEGTGSNRSPLLEDFRNRHAKARKFELKDILGSVVEFSGDQHGSRFIQEKLVSASLDERAAIFDEILPHARALMTDVFGNYVIQKIFEHGSDAQRSILAQDMESHILPLSLGTYGCRVVQKAFDHTTPEQRIKLAKELDGHVLQCVRDQNANHVVQKIIERVDSVEVDFIPKAFQAQVPLLAAHCYSCRVLQRIFEHCDESQSRPLLQELHSDSMRLMQDQYGNYVIQWVLQRGQPQDKAQVISKIKGSILQLSRHKFASNVIEEVIRTSSAQDRSDMINEILTPKEVTPDGPDAAVAPAGQPLAPAVLMMRDQFANYVLQRFLEKADREQRAKLIQLIQNNLSSTKKFTQGHPTKHLIAIERFIETLPEHSDASASDKAQPSGQVAPAT